MWVLKNKDVAKRLKTIREKTSLSPRRFSMKAGIDQSQYLKIEKGVLPITENIMAKLVATYQADPEYILYGTIVPPETSAFETQAEYQVPIKSKVAAHDALLSVLVSEVAAMRAASSGEHPEVVVKKIYKAADDVAKLASEE